MDISEVSDDQLRKWMAEAEAAAKYHPSWSFENKFVASLFAEILRLREQWYELAGRLG